MCKAEVVKLREPFVRISPVARTVPSAVKVTVPGIGTGGYCGMTVMVMVTGWPKIEGLGEAVTIVVVVAGTTNCRRTGDVLLRVPPSPL